MQLRNKPLCTADQTDNDQAITINAKLTKWWNEVDDYLESNSHKSAPISHSHQVTLNVLRYESTIALNRNILATSEKNSAYHAALQNCIAASRSVINTLYKALKSQTPFEVSPGQEVPENTPLLWPSFTWAVWMSAFIISFAANEDQVPYETASRYVFKNSITFSQAMGTVAWMDFTFF